MHRGCPFRDGIRLAEPPSLASATPIPLPSCVTGTFSPVGRKRRSVPAMPVTPLEHSVLHRATAATRRPPAQPISASAVERAIWQTEEFFGGCARALPRAWRRPFSTPTANDGPSNDERETKGQRDWANASGARRLGARCLGQTGSNALRTAPARACFVSSYGLPGDRSRGASRRGYRAPRSPDRTRSSDFAAVLAVANSAANRRTSPVQSIRRRSHCWGSSVLPISQSVWRAGPCSTSSFESSTSCSQVGAERLFHAAMTETFAVSFVAMERARHTSEGVFLAGMLHNIGKSLALRSLSGLIIAGEYPASRMTKPSKQFCS